MGLGRESSLACILAEFGKKPKPLAGVGTVSWGACGLQFSRLTLHFKTFVVRGTKAARFSDSYYSLSAASAGVKREEDLKVREKTLQSLRIKGAFTAQELYDGHRGKTAQ